MKKVFSGLVASLMVLSMAGCSSSTAKSSSTYTGTGKGNNGDIVVEVTLDADKKITAVDVKEHQETAGISDPAIEQIPQEIVDAQSVSVDTVTGATHTSEGIIEGVTNALESAGVDVSALGASSTDATGALTEETAETDVLVIGGGMAGLSAALAAKDAGAEVTLVEKGATLGGTVNVAGGYLIAADSEMFKDTDTPNTLEDFKSAWAAHMSYSGVESGYPDEERLDLVLSKTGETVDWLATKGAVFAEEPFTAFDGGTYVCAADTEAGAGLVKQLSATIDSEGIVVVLNAEATELTTDESGAVTGAVVNTKDATTTYTAKAVILATGGYANNDEMLAEYAPKLAAVNTMSGAVITATGDGFRMAQEVGAEMFEAGTGFGSLWATSVEPSALELCGDLGSLSFAKALGVDGLGVRFASEAPSVAYMDATASDMIQDGNGPFWYIFDSSDADSVALLTAGAEAGAVKTSDTIEGLAKETGLSAEELQITYDSYNQLCAEGTDSEFNKAAENLVAIEKAPFYAVQYVPTTFGSTGGVKTDADQRVLNAEGTAIKGLYAAGEMSNRYFYNENYMLGGSLGLYATCGRTAGTNAAAE